MSQDIRSFFSITPKNKAKDVKPEIGNLTNKRSRKAIILDSDSDDEPISKVSKKDKTPKGRKINKNDKNAKESPVASKYFEVSKSSVVELLGTAPVKRVQQVRNFVNKKTKIVDEFGDDDFDAAFQELHEEEDWFKNLKCDTSPIIETKNSSPSKQETLQSPKKEKQSSSGNGFTSPNKKAVRSPRKKAKSASPQRKSKNGEPINSKIHPKIVTKSPEIAVILPTKSKLTHIEKKAKIAIVKEKENLKRTPKKETTNITLSSLSPIEIKKSNNTHASSLMTREEFKLWVEKHKPMTLKQIIGQQGAKSNMNKLLKWLKDWYNNNSGNKKISKPSPWAKDDSGAYFKAALLSGSPGVGKTTTAVLVCKELSMDTVEFNASDTRSKRMLNDQVSELLSTKSISNYFYGNGEVSSKHVLLMDEVDGMAGNEDRGGVQELINLIKNTKIPIICMCNDRNHPKIRSLVNYCFDLRFSKPRADQIKGAMMSICFKEKLKLKPETLTEIITTSNQDIRLILNHLSMLAAKESDLEAVSKSIKLGPWDVLKKVFSEQDHKKMSLYDKSDLFFHDYSVAPLFVHENYLMVVPHSEAASTKKGKMELFSKAMTSLSIGDMMESAIRSKNAWSLLPVQAIFSSVIPGEVLVGHMGGQIGFPAWFGKNSRQGKLDRLSQELQVHTRLKTSCNKEAMRLDYSRVLKDNIAYPLFEQKVDGIEKSLDFLKSYDLLREDIESLIELNSWPGSKDLFQEVESKVKAAFTRAYNKSPVLTPFSITAPVKKSRRGGGSQDDYDEEEGDEGVNSENEDDMSADAMITVKKAQTHKLDKGDKKTEKKPRIKEQKKLATKQSKNNKKEKTKRK